MNISNREIMAVALRQSAVDCNCTPEDFLRDQPVITRSRPHPQARTYMPLPLECDLVCYGHNVVAQTSERLHETVSAYVHRYEAMRCFETPALQVLEDALRTHGMRVCFMAEYFLPDMNVLKAQSCAYELRVLTDLSGLDAAQWSNCLSSHARERDVLGVGAYDGEKLIGLAACSADCAAMWQIGVDVLADYRHQGIASAVTSRLALEVLERGIVPFYCAAWSNIASVRNAIRSGFRPAWVELTARDEAFVRHMNGI